MIFLFIFLIIILMILTMRIKLEFIDFKFSTISNQHINKDYKLKIIVYIFNKIPLLKTKITNEKIKKIISNNKIRNTIEKQEIKIIENRKDIDKQILKKLKNMQIEIEEMNLGISIGTENSAITAFIIPIISSALAIFLAKKVKKYNNKQIFSITPIYINQNLINVDFSGIIQIKMIHIINTIFIIKKRKRVDKNGRTSNRGTYDYSYE